MEISYRTETRSKLYAVLENGKRELLDTRIVRREVFAVDFRLDEWLVGAVGALVFNLLIWQAGAHPNLLWNGLAVLVVLLIFATSYRHTVTYPQEEFKLGE